MSKLLLKCFIASAFDKNDVDIIYKNVLAPILRKLSIKPLRVDKIEHNDDIDDKIISLIEESDLCIADLTYARPSVYYEAGYAFGRYKPVVYIVRKDHFKTINDDPNGLLRVHFDLQMKNIISWSIKDKLFPKKLEKRIIKIIFPIIHKKKLIRVQKDEENSFNKNSLLDKEDQIVYKAKSLFKSRGFSIPKPKPGSIVYNNSFSCLRDKNNTTTTIYFVIEATFTKKQIEFFGNDFLYHQDHSNNSIINFHIIVSTFRALSKARVKEWLGKFKEIDHDTFYCIKNVDSKFAPTNIYIHLIDNIKSELDFVSRLKSIQSKW